MNSRTAMILLAQLMNFVGSIDALYGGNAMDKGEYLTGLILLAKSLVLYISAYYLWPCRKEPGSKPSNQES